MIKSDKKIHEKLIAHCKEVYPIEACGLLAGIRDGENIEITKVYQLKNIDESKEHFTMDSAEQFATIKKIRKENLVLLGNYHSHPYTPSRLSDEDMRLAYDKSLIYAIISLADINNPVLNIFSIDKENKVTKLNY